MSHAYKISDFRIWIGDARAAQDQTFLVENRIAGVLDVGTSNRKFFHGIRYSVFEFRDDEIATFFEEAIRFIELTRDDTDANVLIICDTGSRCATFVMAWMIKKLRLPSVAALALVRKFRRDVVVPAEYMHALETFTRA